MYDKMQTPERGLVMLAHSGLLALVAYAILVYLMATPPSAAENKSMLVLSGALAYMILFGHALPKF